MSNLTQTTTTVYPVQNTSIPKENPLRGISYKGAAIKFRSKYHDGCLLSWDEFCQWAYDVKLMAQPIPDTNDKQSDQWLAHLQRRHKALTNLNRAGSHTRMNSHGGAFVVRIYNKQQGILIVNSVVTDIVENKSVMRIKNLSNTYKRQLVELIQSADWAQLPAHERLFAEAIRHNIENFVEIIDNHSQQIECQIAELRHNIAINPQHDD
jgi:hypothetical protein